MKKSAEITSLPIISILDGNQVGEVKSLVVNPDKGSVDFLIIGHEDLDENVKAIPFKKVVGIGEYAVTIENESAIIDLNEIPIANQLVHKKIKVTNVKVMTRKGELLGEVQEYCLDQETGDILGLQLKVADREVVLASNSVVTLGKDIIIVKEDASSHFLHSVAELKVTDEINEETTNVLLVPDNEPFVADEEVQSLKDKQVELLLGKKLTKTIFDKDGNLLFAEGTVLTSENIKQAQLEGPSIIVELSMNVEI